MFHVEHLKLYFRAEAWGTGFGDFLQVMSAVPCWQQANPGKPVTVAYQWLRNSPAYLHFPGVEYRQVERLEDDGYIDALKGEWDPPRNRIWKELGLDWNDKRFWYWLTDDEVGYARMFWQSRPRPWITVQTSGGMFVKRWGPFSYVPDVVAEKTGGTVMVLDSAGVYSGRLPRVGMGDQRLCMAIAATSDLFVGWDSGPFYASIGRLVPSVGIFNVRCAGDLYYPVHEPSTIALEGDPRSLEPATLLRSSLELLEATYDVGRPDKSFRSGWAFR